MNKQKIIDILTIYKELNSEKYGLLALGFFGSCARGEAGSQSDVDIVLQTKTPDLFQVVHIKEELESQLQASVDIVRLREKMNPYLKKQIEQDAIYV